MVPVLPEKPPQFEVMVPYKKRLLMFNAYIDVHQYRATVDIAEFDIEKYL